MNDHRVFRAIGLMAGTSLDGVVDVALVETDGMSHVKPLDFFEYRYSGEDAVKIFECFGKRERDQDVLNVEKIVTNLHIEAVKASGFEAELIGFHGQTITHDPASLLTIQLGDGATMAEALGMDVVCDFRSADVRAGGQGAPLAPLYHQAILAEHEKPVAVLNMGGVGNVTYIGQDKVLAFDTGPANALMDDYAKRYFDADFDENGVIAESGKADRRVVDLFLSDPYFARMPPKSLDREDFHRFMTELPEDRRDGMATLAVMSAVSVMASVKHLPRLPKVWYVCGGGRKNGFLMRLLEDMLIPARVLPIEQAGFDGDAIEAQAFAYLAVRSVLGLPLSLPSTTGIAEPQTGGVLHRA